MDWSNEPYVRIYKKKTVQYLLYPWQSRAVRNNLLVELDRSGILDLGESDAIDAVAVVIGLPRDVVEVGLPPMIKDGTFVINGNKLISPNYISAQEASKSNKERQREFREKRRENALQIVTECNASVTECYETVTSGNELSHGVTPRNSVPCSAVPYNTEQTNSSESDDVRHVFDYWKKIFWAGKGKEPKLDDKRRGKIKARLREGFSTSDLFAAILGASKSDYHVSNGYTKLETILRDAGTVESHMARLSPGDSDIKQKPQEVLDAERILKTGTESMLANGNRERYQRTIEEWKNETRTNR